MGLLSKIARAGGRATGRALSRHVLPDSLTPSWKTQKAVSTGYSLLKKAARLTGKKKKPAPNSKPYKSAALGRVARPAPKAPKQKFDKNAWSGGRNLVTSFDGSRPSPVKSSSASSRPKRAFLSQRAKDALRNPRLLAQMKIDEIKIDLRNSLRSLSKF